VLVLDDGFQQRARFPGALALVTINGRSPFGNGSLLPAGPLREPRRALSEADGIVVTRGRLEPPAARDLRRFAPRVPHVVGDLRLTALVDRRTGRARPLAWLKRHTVLALSAIGDPDGFGRSLAGVAGHPVAARLDFPDHHAWTRDDIARAGRAAVQAGCRAIVITEKDAVKWPPGVRDTVLVLVARAGMHFSPAARTRLRGWLRRMLAGGSR
jgi:tetraacyldisaccharide 4'-kinase